MNRQPSDALFGPPMSRAAKAWSHVTWAVRHPVRLAVVSLAAIPAVRRHVVSTTPIKDHPMWPVIERARKQPPRAPVGRGQARGPEAFDRW